MSGHTFARDFALARLRRLYPSARVEVLRSPMSNHSRVSFTVEDRDLVTHDREQLLRDLNRQLTPMLTRRRHWSLFRRQR